MSPPDRNDPSLPKPFGGETFGERWGRRWATLSGLNLRDGWWWLLDQMESHRRWRWVIYFSLGAIVVGGAWWFGLEPWLDRRNAIVITRKWLDAGRLDYAAMAAREALAVDPDRPEAWQLAAEISRRRHNATAALIYSSNAAKLAPNNVALTLEWASDGLLAKQPDVAQNALDTLTAEVLANSAPAQRIAGEIARQALQFTPAREHFETALHLDGPLAIDEVPLGTILLHSREAAVRDHGLFLLTKWSDSPEWGAAALRALLDDAIAHDDHPTMLRWADALRLNPRCTLADIPSCLLALARADNAHCSSVLTAMEHDQAKSPPAIALMLGWLAQLGRQAEAVQWIHTLPDSVTGKPPALIAVAEALRQASAWSELDPWVAGHDWSGEKKFLGTVYALAAARGLNQTGAADQGWQTLQNQAHNNGGQALFAADLIYAWGWQDQAVALLWIAADSPDSAGPALGTLLRHYQSKRDADGQYRAYARLHVLRPQDAGLANNFAYYAVLTGNGSNAVEQIIRDNHAHDPANVVYLSTYAYWLCAHDQAANAMQMLKPIAERWPQSPPVAFAYGLALAGTGDKAEARKVLGSLNAGLFSDKEAALIKTQLNLKNGS